MLKYHWKICKNDVSFKRLQKKKWDKIAYSLVNVVVIQQQDEKSDIKKLIL